MRNRDLKNGGSRRIEGMTTLTIYKINCMRMNIWRKK
jgi:hypothetical protein